MSDVGSFEHGWREGHRAGRDRAFPARELADAIDAEADDLRAEQVSQHQIVGVEATAALHVARILSGALRRLA